MQVLDWWLERGRDGADAQGPSAPPRLDPARLVRPRVRVDGRPDGRGRPAGRWTSRIIHAWPLAVVLRAPSAGGPCFLKCAGPMFAHEASITATLATRMPNHVPEVIAIEPDENWLLMGDLGDDIVGRGPADGWGDGLARLAELQLAWAGEPDALIRAGLPRRPLAGLAADLPNFVGESGLGDRLRPAVREEWDAAVPRLVEACERLGALGVPDTVVHGDFHPWNVARTTRGLVVFDWSDGSLGSPFVDLPTTLGRTPDVAIRRVLADRYLAAWPEVAEADRPRVADLAMLVGSLYQVQSYLGSSGRSTRWSRWISPARRRRGWVGRSRRSSTASRPAAGRTCSPDTWRLARSPGARAQANVTTWRAASPARRRSKASSRSASGRRRSMRRSIGQPAREVRVRVGREVDRGDRGPVVGADDPAPAVDERERLEACLLAERREADEDRRPARRQGRDRLLDRRRQPDRLEHEVRPALARGLADAVDDRPGVGGIGLDPVRRPQRAGEVDLRPAHVDRDDPPGPDQLGAHHARQPDPAEADDGDGRARGHLGGLDHGAHARRDAAPDQRRDLGRHAVGHRDHRGRRHDLGRGHRPDREVGEDRRAVGAGEARRPVGLRVAQRRRSGAQPLAAALALAAAQAGRVPGQGDRPPDDARVEPRTDRLDHARALVAQHDRPRPLPVAVPDVEVGVADARRGHPHEDLARARVVEPQRLDGAAAPACSMTAASISRMPLRCPIQRRAYPVFWRPAAMPLIVTPITVRIAVASAGARSGRRSRPSSSTWTADSAST